MNTIATDLDGTIYLNNEKFTGENLEGGEFPLLFESLMIVRRGKKNYCLVRFN